MCIWNDIVIAWFGIIKKHFQNWWQILNLIKAVLFQIFYLKCAKSFTFIFKFFILWSSRVELFFYDNAIVDHRFTVLHSLKHPQQLGNVKYNHIVTFRERVLSNDVLHMQTKPNPKIYKITLFSNLNRKLQEIRLTSTL